MPRHRGISIREIEKACFTAADSHERVGRVAGRLRVRLIAAVPARVPLLLLCRGLPNRGVAGRHRRADFDRGRNQIFAGGEIGQFR